MSVDPYQSFTNQVTGETFRCIASTDEVYTTEWSLRPGGFVPFEHVHVNQTETFHIQEGEMRVLINGRESVGGAGETIAIPRGARHIAYNDKAETLRCILEYKPALDSQQMFQCFAGLTLDGDINRWGIVSIPKMMYFMRKLNARAVARPSFVPGPVFSLLMWISYMIGSLAGWERLYRKYTA
jgi:quercetin dioxygenase-like cupin family protein